MHRPAASQPVRSTPNPRINPGGPNNPRLNLNHNQGSSGVNTLNNSVSSNRNVNRSFGLNNYSNGNGNGGYGSGGYGGGYGSGGYGRGYGSGYGGFSNGLGGYVRVYIPGLGWVLVPRQALRGSLRGNW
jgi:hypothetical protein